MKTIEKVKISQKSPSPIPNKKKKMTVFAKSNTIKGLNSPIMKK